MINRKNRRKSEKEADFSSSEFHAPEEEQKRFLEFLKFQALAERLRERYKVSAEELAQKLEEDVLVPVSIFCRELGSFEIICKYLKENLGLSNKRIAELTGRSGKSVWQAYNSARVKFPKRFEVKTLKYFFPVSILKNRGLSVLENIVVFLRDKFELSYHEVALLLKRDDRTVWTVYQKARKKYAKR